MVIRRTFNGGLNFDDARDILPPGDYIDAYNISMDADTANQDSIITNIAGNRKVDFTLPEGTNQVISGDEGKDNVRNRLIFFIWNSQGYHTIAEFDKTTRTTTKIFQSRTDSADIDILNLQLAYKVNHINIVHRQEEGDLLLWNDAYNRPGQLNIDDFKAGIYGNAVTDDLIRLARLGPLDALEPTYGDQAPVSTVNNFKKKLFRYRYRWVYKNGEKSMFSPISKVPLPVNAYDTDVESDSTKNNQTTLIVTGGPADYQKIEIAGQQSINNVWSDFFLIDSLDRDDYGISPGGTYSYVFLNDGEYPFIEVRESDLLFDYVPDVAKAMELVNGNTLVFAAITEGYDAIRRSDVNVQISASYIPTNGNGEVSGNPEIDFDLGRTQFGTFCTPFGGNPRSKAYLDITIGSTVTEGDIYNVGFDPFGAPYTSVSYTALAGDTNSIVAQTLRTSLDASLDGSFVVTYIAPDKVRVLNNVCTLTGSIIFTNININAVPASPVVSAGSQATWKWNAKYRLGIIYFDKYGKTNGVISFVSNTDDPTDFSVTTPDFVVDATTRNPNIPVINASINHIPPSWAVRYQWVRTLNQSISSFVQLATMDVQDDSDYYYFCIEGLIKFKTENSGFVPTYTFAEGDRLRVMADIDIGGEEYGTTTYSDDFEILGTVQRTIAPSVNGTFVKIKKNATVFSGDNYLVELYRPATRTSDNTTVFHEFGENYGIYTDVSTGIRYHLGGNQDQTAAQPATFTFLDGDVYYKFRPQYENTSLNTFVVLGLMDANYSDYWASAVNSNGRPSIIDSNAQRLYDPVLIRFGQAYQPGTDVNGLNRFYEDNLYDKCDRSFGDIMRLHVRDRLLRVYQKLKVGAIPVLTQILKDASGNDVVTVSDELLNPIRYYAGDYGIGDHPESLASNNYADYFVTNIRGVICRLSQDGLTPISILYKANSFAVDEIGSRGFDSKIYGAFDEHHNKYIMALEANGDSPAQTISFNEIKNRFDTRLRYTPEGMACLNQLLITFKNGELWTHDNTTYNNFYGIQYTSSVTGIFNDGPDQKKAFQVLAIVSRLYQNQWIASAITTSLDQVSNLNQVTDFRLKEGVWSSAFLRDANSPKGITGGDTLKGRWMEITLETVNSSVANDLIAAEVKYILSNLNIR